MSDHDNKIDIKNMEDWEVGQPLEARKLQQPVDILKRIGSISPGNQDNTQKKPFEIRRFEVVRLEEDIIICTSNIAADKDENEDTLTPAEIPVAMPYLMRKTPFETSGRNNGQFTFTYTFTEDDPDSTTTPPAQITRFDKRTSTDTENDDDEEIQVIVGSYLEGDIIFACTGIIRETGLFIDDAEEFPLVWQDMNFDGRFWALSEEDEEETT